MRRIGVAGVVERIGAGHRLAHLLHARADPGQLLEQGVDGGALIFQVRKARDRDAVELLRALRLDAGVADLFQVGERGVDHAGAWRVVAVRARLDRLDELVAVAGALGEQGQKQQLQVRGAELAATLQAVQAGLERFAAEAAPAAEPGKAAMVTVHAVAAMIGIVMTVEGIVKRVEKGVHECLSDRSTDIS